MPASTPIFSGRSSMPEVGVAAGMGSIQRSVRQGIQPLIPVSEFGFLGAMGSFSTGIGSGMQSRIPVSELGLLGEKPSATFNKVVQRLFEETRDLPNGGGNDKDDHISIPPNLLSSRFPIRCRVLLPRLQTIPMQHRQTPLVVSDSSDSSESESEVIEVTEPIIISQVVSEILGRGGLQDSDSDLFSDIAHHPMDNGNLEQCDNPPIVSADSPVGFRKKDKQTNLSKKARDTIVRKDGIVSANLTRRKVKVHLL